MISITIILLVAAIGVVTIAKLLHGSMEHPGNLNELLEQLEPVNAACFRHLASETDEVYLRKRLPNSTAVTTLS